MLRSYIAAACRNLWRNKLYAAINIAGLAVGFTAGLLIALFVHDEHSYDRFWPHHEQVYMITSTLRLPGLAPFTLDAVMGQVIPLLRQRLPASVLIARSMEQPHSVRRGQIEENETVSWVDPGFFSVLRPVAIAGDLDQALERPDGLVLTEHVARKYFGDGTAVGQLLQIDRKHVMRVTAVVRDIPSNSFLKADIFGSGRASFAGLGAFDAATATPKKLTGIGADMEAYIRVPPAYPVAQVAAALQAAGDSFLAAAQQARIRLSLALLPVAAIHLSPPSVGSLKPRGNPALLLALVMIGVGIVAMAAINFVNLMTARAARRATEIGARKALGATPLDVTVQFLGESLLYSMAAMLIAVALIEMLLPAFNGFLHRDIALAYGPDLSFCLLVAVLVGLGAGAYPALVLARFRPASVLRGVVQTGAGGAVRQSLVVLQFAVLICLFVATVVVYRQVDFALNEGLRFDKDQVLVIMNGCKGSLPDEVRKLPGVRAAACTESTPLGRHNTTSGAVGPDGTQITVRNEAIAPGLLELYGVHPVAGRFFRTDEKISRGGGDVFIGPVVINETAVRKLHFRSAQAAVGQTLRHAPGLHTTRTDVSEIVGVAPDIPVDSVRAPVEPTVFHSDADDLKILSVKLRGMQIPQTLKAIDALWQRIGRPWPIERVFVDQMMQERYTSEVRQGQMFAAFAGVAVLIACLGLFGLAAFTAERRTKEIGVRKALGAMRGEIIRMLLWQLTRPVLVANLIAWPLGFYLMRRWLEGFAYHIDLTLWVFVAAGAVAIAVAWLTVSTHAYLIARQPPAAALRYE